MATTTPNGANKMSHLSKEQLDAAVSRERAALERCSDDEARGRVYRRLSALLVERARRSDEAAALGFPM